MRRSLMFLALVSAIALFAVPASAQLIPIPADITSLGNVNVVAETTLDTLAFTGMRVNKTYLPVRGLIFASTTPFGYKAVLPDSTDAYESFADSSSADNSATGAENYPVKLHLPGVESVIVNTGADTVWVWPYY